MTREGQPGYQVTLGERFVEWSPADAFEDSFSEISPDGAMTFGHAIELMKLGYPMARAGWNGRGMCVYLNKGFVDSDLDEVPAKISGVNAEHFERGGSSTVTRLPHISMLNAEGHIVTGWLASQTDMLAEDWQVAA